MVALSRRQVAPGIFLLTQVRLLRRIHAIPLIELLANPALLIGRKILKRPAVLQPTVALLRRQITHLVHPGTRRSYTKLLARRRHITCTRAISLSVVVTRSVIKIVVRPLILPRLIIRSPIRVGRRTVRIHRARRSLRRRR